MTKVATRDPRLGDLVQAEYGREVGYCRKTITVNEAAETEYKIGQVLGIVTADGKGRTIEATAADGSEDFAGIYIGSAGNENSQTVAATTDTEVVVLYRGPCTIGEDLLKYGASVDSPAEVAAIQEQMVDAGFNIQEQPNQFA